MQSFRSVAEHMVHDYNTNEEIRKTNKYNLNGILVAHICTIT